MVSSLVCAISNSRLRRETGYKPIDPPNMAAEQSRTAEGPASDENSVRSRRAAWRIIARTERTSETEAGEGALVDAEELHDDTLYDVSSFGIYKIKGVGDVFAGRVEHGTVKPRECPGDNVDFNIKGLDKTNVARSRGEGCDERGVTHLSINRC